MNKRTKNTGITLISLVITIIIMLILVGVSITLAVNGGLFEYAGNAVGDTRNAMEQEQELINNIIDKHIKPNVPGEGGEDPTDGETISEEKSYIGYYADVDGDGEADGVIYADLAFSKSGTWNDNNWSNYEYAEQDDLKEYKIVDKFTGDFKEQDVIAQVKGTTGDDRFYVMALEDIKATIDEIEYTTFYWYKAAYGILDGTVATDYNDFGKGKSNTIAWLNNWNNNTAKYGEQNARDLWGVIQESEKYSIVKNENDSGKWFVPSRAEWSAFGDYLYTSLGVTTSNYGTYNLYTRYWSSSIYTTYYPYTANFYTGSMNWISVADCYAVRLSATF